MKRVNFHRKIGLRPGFGVIFESYGKRFVIGLRLNWSAVTVTI